MKFKIKHEIKGRMRIHIAQKKMTCKQADIIQYHFSQLNFVTSVKVYDRTQDVVICFVGERESVIEAVRKFHYTDAQVPETFLQNSGRELNREYWEKLVNKVIFRYGEKIFFPQSLRAVITLVKSVKYIREGIRIFAKGRLEVPVLDAIAIGVSICRRDMNTAASVMFQLRI